MVGTMMVYAGCYTTLQRSGLGASGLGLGGLELLSVIRLLCIAIGRGAPRCDARMVVSTHRYHTVTATHSAQRGGRHSTGVVWRRNLLTPPLPRKSPAQGAHDPLPHSAPRHCLRCRAPMSTFQPLSLRTAAREQRCASLIHPVRCTLTHPFHPLGRQRRKYPRSL